MDIGLDGLTLATGWARIEAGAQLVAEPLRLPDAANRAPAAPARKPVEPLAPAAAAPPAAAPAVATVPGMPSVPDARNLYSEQAAGKVIPILRIDWNEIPSNYCQHIKEQLKSSGRLCDRALCLKSKLFL